MTIQEIITSKFIAQNKEYTIIPSPDFLHRKEIEEAIKENEGYCCCAIQKTDDTKCMCKAFREQDTYGFCHCGRYYKILKATKVCLCGSTRFRDLFYEVDRELTMHGCIVEMPGVFAHCGDPISDDEKTRLDELHKTKISDCDIVFVINKEGYIGDSTKNEIEWAMSLGKPIIYLEE